MFVDFKQKMKTISITIIIIVNQLLILITTMNIIIIIVVEPTLKLCAFRVVTLK